MVGESTPVLTLWEITCAPDTTAPLGSVTSPVIVPVTVWATAALTNIRANNSVMD
jgi:hypothetical protein